MVVGRTWVALSVAMGSELEQCGRMLGLVVVVPNWSSSRLQDLGSFIGRDWF